MFLLNDSPLIILILLKNLSLQLQDNDFGIGNNNNNNEEWRFCRPNKFVKKLDTYHHTCYNFVRR